jgi:type IV secretory pathway VirB3-like protein
VFMKLHLCTSQVTCTRVNKILGVDMQYTAKVKNLWFVYDHWRIWLKINETNIYKQIVQKSTTCPKVTKFTDIFWKIKKNTERIKNIIELKCNIELEIRFKTKQITHIAHVFMKLHLCTSQVTCTRVNKILGVDTQYTAGTVSDSPQNLKKTFLFLSSKHPWT